MRGPALLTAWLTARAGTVAAGGGEDTPRVPTPDPFSYKSPENWHSRYPACGGSKQSPIDLDRTAVSIHGPYNGLRRIVHYPVAMPGKADVLPLEDNTKTMEVPGRFGSVQLWPGPSGRFEVQQFHFHFPSEHTVDGKHYAGEMHIVHTNSQGHVLVIGLFFEEGKLDNPFLETLDWQKKTLPQAEREIFLHSPLNITGSFSAQFDGDYFSYGGSLTTPPCTEGVHWLVLAAPAPVSARQVEAFKLRFPDPMNNRPVQARNGRILAIDKLPPLEMPSFVYRDGSVTQHVLAFFFTGVLLAIFWIECCKK